MEGEALAVVLALAAAVSWGLSTVLVRQGLTYFSTATGTLVSLATGVALVSLLVAAFQSAEVARISTSAVLLFALIGILNFPLGRFFNYMSVERLGVGRSTPILASAPLFAMALAVIFTGESVTFATLAGTFLILAGLYVTLRGPGARNHAGN